MAKKFEVYDTQGPDRSDGSVSIKAARNPNQSAVWVMTWDEAEDLHEKLGAYLRNG